MLGTSLFNKQTSASPVLSKAMESTACFNNNHDAIAQ